MNPRIWASLDDYLHPSFGMPWLGRNMANHYFISALFRYGTFDEYHFFLANAAHRQLFLNAHESLITALNLTDRVKVFDRLDLPEKLSNNDYTVFHQSDHINFFSALCRLRNRFGKGFPVTAFIHSISYQEYMPKYLEMSLAGADSHDALICSSKCGKTALKKVFSRLEESFEGAPARMQMPVVPLGINEQNSVPNKEDARERLGIRPDEIVALCFGRFSELDKMDLFPLLQAFLRIVPSVHSYRLILAGSVHSKSYLDMLTLWMDALSLSDAVRIITDPNEDQKRDLFSAADFFVSLSDNPQETFGLTLLEAMHAGLPLAVSDFDGYRELVTHDVGFRIPTLWSPMDELDILQPVLDERTFHLLAAQSVCVDVEQTADALHQLFSNADLRYRMGQAAKMRFGACYVHQGIIRRLEGLWCELKSGFQQKSTGPKDPLSLCTFDTFSHYTTSVLNNEMRVLTTALGREILSQRGTYPLLPNMAKMIDSTTVLSIMRHAHAPISIQALSEIFGTPDRFRYTILWMLKHELISPRA